MTRNTVTKKQLQDVLDDVGEKLHELLNPALNREEIVVGIQELDQMLNGTSEDDEEEEDDNDEE